MPVRLRITFLFALVVFVILGLVCGAVYYFSYVSRVNTIKTRLTNRGITTARLLSQSEIFSQQMIQRIDSSTTLALKNKIVQAYDYQNGKIYQYSDIVGDTLKIDQEILDETRVNGTVYFAVDDKEAIAHHYIDPLMRMVIVTAGEDEEGKRNLTRLKNILFFSFLGGVFVAIGGGYFFSGGLLMPIKKITDEVTEISARNLTRRINAGKTKDEWHQLALTLNELMNRLQESFEVQRRFISNASHELSTPLTSMSSQLEVSLQRERSTAEYREVLFSVLQDVKQMSKLIQTLLEFAKASGDTGGLDIDLVRLDEILLRVPAEMQKQDKLFSVSLDFKELPEDEEKLLVFGNEELLFIAIKNIVVNACKYSHDNRATVTLSISENFLLVDISDKGIGISPGDLPNIFQPFYRVDESRSTEGFGLGLSLANRIIKLHKGEIKVKSQQGKGTTFTVRLPSGKK